MMSMVILLLYWYSISNIESPDLLTCEIGCCFTLAYPFMPLSLCDIIDTLQTNPQKGHHRNYVGLSRPREYPNPSLWGFLWFEPPPPHQPLWKLQFSFKLSFSLSEFQVAFPGVTCLSWKCALYVSMLVGGVLGNLSCSVSVFIQSVVLSLWKGQKLTTRWI